MDYFANGGTNEGFSLQDMIERDIGNSMSDPSDQHTLNSIDLNGFDTNSQNQMQNSEAMTFKIEDESYDTTLDNDQNMSSLNNLSWLCDSNVTVDAQNSSRQNRSSNVTVENNNPNLLVDPSTGMPIQQQQQQVIQIPLSQPVQIINSDGSRQTVAYTLPSNAGLQQTLLSSNNQRQNATPVLHCNAVNMQQQYPNNITQHVTHVSKPSPPITTVTREEKQYPKPVYSYSCLIALALKNSSTGYLPVADISFYDLPLPILQNCP
ncbi:unnamed protein product [Owenia fusiformis]|uniref:Uncharacterized protein n=1 Tax=Owenia fusiformis TaxID=6347 RepID=A0A8S4NWH9_OWEFU|nr:unnamed protein product [Owenia fusiformis]